MLERELKFHVPARQRAGLKMRLNKMGADTIELHARYYDTDDESLARAGIALRLRKEADTWIQTIKTPGPDELSRIEWNHARPEPRLDLSVYSDTHVAALLERHAHRLRCRYVTRVTRLKTIVATESGTAELAYDEGAILANGLGLPIHELEIEGISCTAEELFSLGHEWLDNFRLIIELRSKAERGGALAALGSHSALDIREGWDPNAEPSPVTTNLRFQRVNSQHIRQLAAVVRAEQPSLSPDSSIERAYLECANECMGQIIRNSSFLAGVDGMKTTTEQRIEYVHQIRVGIRRLRACWQLFRGAAHPPAAVVDSLKEYFQVLGQARDLDVIRTELLPRLMHAGMPPDTSQPVADIGHESTPRADLTASVDFQKTLLDLLQHLVLTGDAADADGAERRAAALLSKRLNAWLNRIQRDASGFLDASWDDRHATRKRVKRLRYGMEFAQGVLDPNRLTPLRNALVSAQKALGQLNDLYVAAEYYRGPGARHPSAMFALGWLAATQAHEAKASFTALNALARAGRFKPAATRKARRRTS